MSEVGDSGDGWKLQQVNGDVAGGGGAAPGADDGEGLLTTSEFGRLVGITDEGVRKWIKAGLPVARHVIRSGRSEARLDKELCLAWAKVNKACFFVPGIGQGGKRAGAGRKPAKRDELFRGAVAATGERATAAPIPAHSVTVSSGGAGAVGETVALTPMNEAKLRQMRAEARIAEIEAAEREGAMVPREDAAKVWGLMLQVFADRLDSLAERCSTEIAVRLGVADGGARLQIEDVIRADVERARRELSEDPLGESSAAAA